MVVKRSIFSFVATAATIHPGKGEEQPSIWFETIQGPVRVEMPTKLACELADKILAEFRPSHAKKSQ